MALTLSQLVAAIAKYETRLSGSDHDKAALARNLALLARRVASTESALGRLAVTVLPHADEPEDPFDPNFDRAAAMDAIIVKRDAYLGDNVGGAISPDTWAKILSKRELAEAVALYMFGPPGTFGGVDYSTFTGDVHDSQGGVANYVNGIAQ